MPDTAPMRKAVDVAIAKVRALRAQVNPLDLLSRVAFHMLTRKEGEPVSGRHSEPQVEYLMSLFLAEPIASGTRAAVPQEIQETIDTVSQLYQDAAFFYLLTSRSPQNDETERDLIVMQRLQSLYVRGDGYPKHLDQTFKEICRQHDAFLRQEYGFSTDELYDLIKHAAACIQLNLDADVEKGRTAFRQLEELFDPILQLTPEDWGSKRAELNEKHADKINAFKAVIDGAIGPNVFAVKPRNATDETILKSISLTFGDNAEFFTKVPAWLGWPFNPTRIRQRPIISHDGIYYAFHLPLLGRSGIEICEGLIAERNPNYWKNTFLKKRDDYVELTAVDLIAGMLPGCTKHLNLNYDCVVGGQQIRTELDGLIQYDDYLLIIEVKASGLGDAARRGAPQSIVSDLEASLDKAYQQASRVLTLVRSTPEVPFFDERGTEVLRLRFSDYRKTFLISVTRDHFGALATRLHVIRKLGLIQGVEWPWATNLHDLRVFAEIINHPTLFLHYLIRRAETHSYPALATSDELDLLMHFLTSGLYFRDDDQVKTSSMVTPLGFTDELDAYYAASADGKKAIKPQYPLPKRLEELITKLEAKRPKHFATACLDILSYDSQAYDVLNKQVIDREKAFKERRLGIAGIANTQHDDTPIVLFGCVPATQIAHNALIERARTHKSKTRSGMVTLILWEPPLSKGQLSVYLL